MNKARNLPPLQVDVYEAETGKKVKRIDLEDPREGFCELYAEITLGKYRAEPVTQFQEPHAWQDQDAS